MLGFFDIEVDAYVSRENMILTFIGMLAGLVMGIALHRFVITVAQLDDFIFCREIHPLSFLIAAAMTMLFAMLVNFALHFRLKKIDLAQSMKSVE